MWYYFMSQQVRFLLPVMPIFAAFAALGLGRAWAMTADIRPARLLLAGAVLVLAINQGLFVGIYATLRLPPALGLKSAAAYHRDAPTMQGAFYENCTYVTRHLEPGERYLGLIWPHSYYCPQSTAAVNGWFAGTERERLYPLKGISLDEVITAFERENTALVTVPTNSENRHNEFSRTEIIAADPSSSFVGRYFADTIPGLVPLARDRFSAVYDGHEILAYMKAKRLERP
ncbi:hypothetical protein [Magnetospirillum sp. 15-1]|uniref:hypothetical protein n=1 Tax=Magnetospirillum sp. 15-1 TaxID=1979370 RepID=UPI000BBBE4BB|nr:hypothetical protein [Magnetospirillum sp. 15-1]